MSEGTLSADRLTLTIRTTTTAGTNTITFGRPPHQPWTDADVTLAIRMTDEAGIARLQPGQENTSRRLPLGRGWWLYVHLMTGPPTWWYPRVDPRGGALMVGWLRAGVAVSVRRESAPEGSEPR